MEDQLITLGMEDQFITFGMENQFILREDTISSCEKAQFHPARRHNLIL